MIVIHPTGETRCTCGDRHPASPWHQVTCPRYDPAYTATVARRERAAWLRRQLPVLLHERRVRQARARRVAA